MRILRAADYRRMPWKNGGGETTEIAVWPENAGLDDFLWRVSMARVERNGPFSAFAGVDRTLTILEGEGLRLKIGGGPAVELRRDGDPFAFPADQPTESSLLGGPVTDLNVMTRRGSHTHTVRRIQAEEKARIAIAAEVAILLCHRGSAAVANDDEGGELRPLDCAILEGPQARLRIDAEPAASLFLVEIE